MMDIVVSMDAVYMDLQEAFDKVRQEIISKNASAWNWRDTISIMRSQHLFLCLSSSQILQLLLKQNATVDASDGNQLTPLHRAADSGTAAVHLLLQFGASIDSRDVLQMTPLHQAAVQGQVAVSRILIQHGADIHARNWMDKTPLHLAAEKGHCHVVQLLISSGADMLAKTKWNETAADLAIDRKQEKVFNVLRGHRIKQIISYPSGQCRNFRPFLSSEGESAGEMFFPRSLRRSGASGRATSGFPRLIVYVRSLEGSLLFLEQNLALYTHLYTCRVAVASL
ncbi:GA-binding protein subunit beta-1-like [Heptranchias perlo]|uniref:GA-binding protein subunit beta-1-like n=1 Tax=Heptranchias perlo TaxID=212740 RepID=UPI00355977FD